MKVTQYQTAKDFVLRPYDLKPMGGKMSGAETVTVSAAPIGTAFRGFGVAITGASCYHLARMDAQERAAFLHDIYSDDGLGLSVARLSVASSDYSAELYSYDDVQNDTALAHFSVSRDDDYIVPMIQEALRVRPDMFIFASPWSPPGWMKTGGSLCGGCMREQFIDCYADYLLRFVGEYEKRGIPVAALTAQNEPETTQDGKMPACLWHPDTEAKFIIALKRRLKAAGKHVEVFLHDHNFSSWQKVLWQLDEYAELPKVCDGVAFHYYSGAVEDMDFVREKYPHLTYHFTEGGPRLYDNYATDRCKWGVIISKALKHGCSTFTGWNLLLDEVGGPNIGPFSCGGLVTRNSQTGALSYSGQYRAFAHFSKYIKPGAAIYDAHLQRQHTAMSDFPGGVRHIELLAAQNPDGTHVLTVSNAGTAKLQLQYEKDGSVYYIEALPDSLSTVIFEK